jgi:hypothetical protein
MDIKQEQIVGLIKYLPIVLIIWVFGFSVYYFFIREEKPKAEFLDGSDYYEISYNKSTDEYDVRLDEGFYDRSAEEIVKDIERINDKTDGRSKDMFVDAPAALFGASEGELEHLYRADPNGNNEQPAGGDLDDSPVGHD